jgi:hypothetical protein
MINKALLTVTPRVLKCAVFLVLLPQIYVCACVLACARAYLYFFSLTCSTHTCLQDFTATKLCDVLSG